MKKYLLTGLAVALSTALTVGCSNTADGARKDAEIAAEEARRASERAAETTEQAGRDAAQAVEHGTEAAADAAHRAGDAAAEGSEKAAQAASEAGAGAKRAAEGAAEATADAANRAGATMDAAQQTTQIKGALMADATVDSTQVDVDTNAGTKTVTLNGSVPTSAQKTRAEQIARDKAPGYRIVNRLAIKG